MPFWRILVYSIMPVFVLIGGLLMFVGGPTHDVFLAIGSVMSLAGAVTVGIVLTIPSSKKE
jgi:hypothetical protein